MLEPTKAALSALKAFERKTATTAHNVANIDTDGFRASRVVMQTAFPVGVKSEVRQVIAPGAVVDISDGTGRSREVSNVDLGKETGTLIIATHGYKANLKTLRTWDDMTKTVINLLA